MVNHVEADVKLLVSSGAYGHAVHRVSLRMFR